MKYLKIALLAVLLCGATLAKAAPLAVAVTDLAYEERVQEYFRHIRAKAKSSYRASDRERERASSSSDWNRDSDRYARSASSSRSGSAEASFSLDEGVYSYIDRGELRKFTADIKGEIIKSGLFKVTQAKPYPPKNMDKLYDVIARIKKGLYPGAQYVLFGSVSSIQFRQEANPIDNTDTVSHTLSLELVADFSLVNTKTYEVKAAFSATGEGQDVKLMSSAGGRIVLNRGKVISEVSKSLGVDVLRQLEEQLPGITGETVIRETVIERAGDRNEEVIIFQ